MADFDGWSLTISEDSMSAVLYMEPPYGRNPYTVDETMEYLRQNGVKNGVNSMVVEEAVELRKYFKSILVAEGVEPVNGVDAYFDVFFETGNLKSPLIRSDGSVDYSSMTEVKCVRKGDKLLTYHPAIPGKHGFDVRGRELRAKPGKEMPTLRIKGVEKSGDGLNYFASTDGRVEYTESKLEVCSKYEHKGDLDLVTGKIDFRGDVVVHGNVCAGTTIRASKSITVDGSVEAATLIAEGDIVLRKGMQGGSKAKIVCGGDLYAHFIEFTDVNVKGNIEANIILNSKLNAGKAIKVSGKKGTIVGGTTYAVGAIDTANLGNKAEIKTEASVGITEELTKRNEMLNSKAVSAQNGIRRAKAELEMINKDRELTDDVKEAKRNQLRRHIKKDERMLAHITEELESIMEIMEIGKDAVINVQEKTFPGSIITIGDKTRVVEETIIGKCFYSTPNSDVVKVRDV